MHLKFRLRVFLFLLLLLALLLASQVAINVFVEWVTCRTHPDESMWVGLEETAHMLGLSLLLVPLLVGLAWSISRRVVAPLRAMATAAERVCAGHWSERIETRAMPDDETKRLAQAMNAAFDGYAAVLQRLERFSGDAAPQLRTPIATIGNLSELLAADNVPLTKAELIRQNDRLAQLVAQLILLARIDTHTLSQQKQPILVDTLLKSSLNPLLPLAHHDRTSGTPAAKSIPVRVVA